jgi:hypothetical protein
MTTYFCDGCDATCDPEKDPHCFHRAGDCDVTLCENCREAAYDRQQGRLMENGPGPSLRDQQISAMKFKVTRSQETCEQVMSDQFVIHRLRSKPVEYTVRIRHFVVDGEWTIGVLVLDIVEDDEQKLRVAADLRRAADILDGQQT